MLQFGQQPTLFESIVPFRCPQRLTQYKSIGFVHWPDRGRYRITAQLLQGSDSLVTVDYQISVRLVSDSHNDDRHLLTGSCQRSQ